MKKTDIFHNASLKLSLTYLLIIMSISLMFSIVVFRVSSNELERSIRRPPTRTEIQLLIGNGRHAMNVLAAERSEDVQEAKARLVNQLTMINVVILVAGGAGSYVLARRSLLPIEQAHEAQSRFTADASHELRTPITAMRAETELALTEPKLTLAQAKKQLTSNMEELDKLTSLSEGLLQLARMDTDTLETSTVRVDHIVAQAAERVEKQYGTKNHKISLPKPTDLTVNVHQASIVEALVTLLDNARKYSKAGSTITIDVKSISKSTVQLSVKDTGVGIKASDLPHIFDRFYRADVSRTRIAY